MFIYFFIHIYLYTACSRSIFNYIETNGSVIHYCAGGWGCWRAVIFCADHMDLYCGGGSCIDTRVIVSHNNTKITLSSIYDTVLNQCIYLIYFLQISIKEYIVLVDVNLIIHG